jgi:hypothetical protein
MRTLGGMRTKQLIQTQEDLEAHQDRLLQEIGRLTARLRDMEEMLDTVRGPLPENVERAERELRSKNGALLAADDLAMEMQLMAGEFDSLWRGTITNTPPPDFAAERLRAGEAAWRAYRELRNPGGGSR